ncbi:hypothetical protein B0T26DRAFT_679994 [Lasiosphaeria miniovina]|uniref:Uncharacterized protein n=1 Tax=Lasiosphaeria miniovina TaxID=1954250 RepID=A0AA39ZZ38_9PEZI|nr:uncharacterized protein B0T26DRAFT_679994 [Lasiosphaeria miniovina]KAK0706287.1 hypothetical protein B0T26DRAFT_679994 [Lasiosphaeria miniovina]
MALAVLLVSVSVNTVSSVGEGGTRELPAVEVAEPVDESVSSPQQKTDGPAEPNRSVSPGNASEAGQESDLEDASYGNAKCQESASCHDLASEGNGHDDIEPPQAKSKSSRKRTTRRCGIRRSHDISLDIDEEDGIEARQQTEGQGKSQHLGRRQHDSAEVDDDGMSHPAEDSAGEQAEEDDDTIRPSPRKRRKADSPTRSALPRSTIGLHIRSDDDVPPLGEARTSPPGEVGGRMVLDAPQRRRLHRRLSRPFYLRHRTDNHRESASYHEVSNGDDGNDDDEPSRTKPKSGQRKAAVHSGTRPSREVSNIDSDEINAEAVRRTDGQDKSRYRLGRRRSNRAEVDDEDSFHPSGDSDGGQDEEDGDTCPPPYKRHKLRSRTRSTLARAAARGQIRSDGGLSRARQGKTSSLGPRHSIRGEEGDQYVPTAKFEEWPLQNAALKRAVVKGMPTFQLQFTWGSYAEHEDKGHATRNPQHKLPAESHLHRKRSYGSRLSFTPEEDGLLVDLKKQKLSCGRKSISSSRTPFYGKAGLWGLYRRAAPS